MWPSPTIAWTFAPSSSAPGAAQPGLRGRQALQVVAGVVVGVVIGEIVVALAGRGTLQIVVVVAVALGLCTAAGAQVVTTVQAGASAILVVALHRPGQNLASQRLVDALIGGGIAVLLARFLFPIDPLALVRREFVLLREDVAAVLDIAAQALRESDRARAEEALVRVDAIDDRRLREALKIAHEVARNAPRRRGAQRRLEALDGLAASLTAAVGDARAVVTGALRTIDTVGRPPPEAIDAVEALAAGLRTRDSETVRNAARRARAAANAALEQDGSLGVAALAHAISSIADDLEGSAGAREAAFRTR